MNRETSRLHFALGLIAEEEKIKTRNEKNMQYEKNVFTAQLL